MKHTKKIKVVFFLIATFFVVHFLLSGINILMLKLSDNAYAQQKGKEGDAKMPDYSVLIRSLERRQAELAMKEEEIKKKEENFAVVKTEIDSRLSNMEKIKKDLEDMINKKTEEYNRLKQFVTTEEDKGITHLVKVYESMKPEDAALLMEGLEREIAIKILSKMKGKNVGKILSKVTPEVAAKMSEEIVKKSK